MFALFILYFRFNPYSIVQKKEKQGWKKKIKRKITLFTLFDLSRAFLREEKAKKKGKPVRSVKKDGKRKHIYRKSRIRKSEGKNTEKELKEVKKQKYPIEDYENCKREKKNKNQKQKKGNVKKRTKKKEGKKEDKENHDTRWIPCTFCFPSFVLKSVSFFH